MKIVFQVESLSHRVNDAAFRILSLDATSINIRCVSDFRFEIEIDVDRLIADGSEHVEFHAHKTASMFLIALSMATFGYFWWAEKGPTGPFYQIRNDEKTTDTILLSQARHKFFKEIRDLTELDVENAVIVWGMLIRDQDQDNWKSYQKGLLLLTTEYLELEFHREAFLNFYRCVEAFVTRKILRIEKLNNEARQIRQALQQIGANQDLLDVFTQVYAIRSSQVAHAQNEQRSIEFDEALASKAFADIVMYKTYRHEAEALRQGNTQRSSQADQSNSGQTGVSPKH